MLILSGGWCFREAFFCLQQPFPGRTNCHERIIATIIILPFDKGRLTVVMDRDEYDSVTVE
jgi:hypothetical protein